MAEARATSEKPARRGRPPNSAKDASSPAVGGTLQTLDRGLQALTIVGERPQGVSIAELADRIGVHRAIAYRLVSTLEGHGFVVRSRDGRLQLGVGLIALASRYEPHLRAVARPVLQKLAGTTRAAAFLAVPRGDDCVAVMVAEPDEGGVLRVAYRVGSRHPLNVGAAGIAILAGRPERADDPPPVRLARRAGYSITRGELEHGAVGVACPLLRPSQGAGGEEASLGIVALGDIDIDRIAPIVVAHAQELRVAVGSGDATDG